jgi:stress response protein SCP2
MKTYVGKTLDECLQLASQDKKTAIENLVVLNKEEKSGFLGFGTKKEELDVDVDLSCVMTDSNGKLVDALYSPLYKKELFQSA